MRSARGQLIRKDCANFLAARQLKPKQYGLLWCDEFGGWNPESKAYNTNLHAHGVYVGPYIPRDLLVEVWTRFVPRKTVLGASGSLRRKLMTRLLIFSNASVAVLSAPSVTPSSTPVSMWPVLMVCAWRN